MNLPNRKAPGPGHVPAGSRDNIGTSVVAHASTVQQNHQIAAYKVWPKFEDVGVRKNAGTSSAVFGHKHLNVLSRLRGKKSPQRTEPSAQPRH
ncbi:hypothetical protein [Amycolatopsis sp. NPDC049868]|uniref:hypothetical protein n=1 Tax=Amycolatopsis sp. NPDC049868 TaxID=3363934 RepID=UPI00378DAF74